MTNGAVKPTSTDEADQSTSNAAGKMQLPRFPRITIDLRSLPQSYFAGGRQPSGSWADERVLVQFRAVRFGRGGRGSTPGDGKTCKIRKNVGSNAV
ncbi:hypothetical protein K239x_20510 [Planctomycetes bacterium K23_9]|uniref:Uncharacterized protein n=1 Tax=Stieleria marina TaxID=1930275 RepID=A0A517NSI8_9BACT|nr:hypothetical protein K239x_20510 [Planctomycetes bacterium K23_9]